MEKQHEFESYPKVPELCGFKIDAYARCGLVASADIHDVGEGQTKQFGEDFGGSYETVGTPPRSANSNMEAAIKRAEEETGTLVNAAKNQSGVASRNESQLTGLSAADICAEMARDAATQAARHRSMADEGDEFAAGAAAQCGAQADALREAQRRIELISPSFTADDGILIHRAEFLVCDPCVKLQGEECHTPECVFCFQPVSVARDVLNKTLNCPIIDGARLILLGNEPVTESNEVSDTRDDTLDGLVPRLT